MQVISQVSEQVEELFGTADDLSLNIKPAPDRWSVAQVLEHLILINESYIPVIRTVRNGQWKPGWLGSRPFMTRFCIAPFIVPFILITGRRTRPARSGNHLPVQ